MKTGDKIVCVDASPCSHCGMPHGYIKNQIYVISATRGTPDVYGSIGVKCIGVDCHPECGTGWNSSLRFRLLEEMKAHARVAAKCSNDPKLSDGGGWRAGCTVGGKAAAEAASVTAGAVR